MKVAEGFIKFLIDNQVLKFGDFTTKSGRKTPFFINTGEYRTGQAMSQLSEYYAQAFLEHFKGEADNLYGPAYKGIPLSVATSMTLSKEYDTELSFTFNRKEAKDHGEGGVLIGDNYSTARKIVIIEDVITAGTSVRESLELLKSLPNADVIGLLVSVDRKEKVDGDLSALEEVEHNFGIKTASIININDIIDYLQVPENGFPQELIDRILAYREQYGVN